MGKKTNWTPAEDLTLCRVWLSASELQLRSEEPKVSFFWNAVLEIFRQEVQSTVERPLNGLKVRWTRINRDSQKFAGIYNELESKGLKEAEDSGGDAAAVATLKEQQWIDEAKGIYHRLYATKFSFEGCWKQLRYSTKWLQLFANSNGSAVSTVLEDPVKQTSHAEVSSTISSEHGIPSTEISTAASAATDVATSAPSHPPTPSTVAAAVAVAAVSTATQDANEFSVSPGRKQRADASLDSSAQISNNQQQQQLPDLTITLVEEFKRHNDLMEDQNTIALLKVDCEMIPDPEARHCFQLLRARYLKRARTTHGYSNGRDSTLV
ncbi:unnamed protein product [Phytophthora lilii]|uniref:Unnamed protein product n=1 Tax=Phytophthora lilii TaxID=2077276 RepID=A0A9W6TQC4_9STRA|nr:unnamed protein product [Phytophthora lilii]